MRASVRSDYDGEGLHETDLPATPLALVSRWVDEAIVRNAEQGDVPEPLAMSLATVDASGWPNVRAVLTRFLDARGPGFLTNLDSTKARELRATERVAGTLVWPAMFRAVRFRGVAEELSREEVAAYFVERPWGSRISAWTSRQSQPVADRHALDLAYESLARRWPDRGEPDDVPLPGFWGGYRIRCVEVEFWAGRRNRLHDRLVYSARAVDAPAPLGESSPPGFAAAPDSWPLLDAAAGWHCSRRQP